MGPGGGKLRRQLVRLLFLVERLAEEPALLLRQRLDGSGFRGVLSVAAG
jgi:hypothetical protein